MRPQDVVEIVNPTEHRKAERLARVVVEEANRLESVFRVHIENPRQTFCDLAGTDDEDPLHESAAGPGSPDTGVRTGTADKEQAQQGDRKDHHWAHLLPEAVEQPDGHEWHGDT